MTNLKYYLLLFFITLVWGTSFFFIKESLDSLDSFEFLFLRFFCATIIITPFLLFNIKKIKKYDVISGFIIGVLLCLVLLMTNLSLEYLTSTKVAIYTGLGVILIAIIESLIIGKWNKLIILCVCCSFTGLIFILDLSSFSLEVGDILGLFLALVIAIHLIMTQRVTQKGDAFLIGIIQIYFAFIVSIITLQLFSFGFSGFHIFSYSNNQDVLFAILYTGALGTALAFIIQTICIQKVGSVKAAIIFNFEPVVGIVFPIFLAYYFNKEKEVFTLLQFTGFILIIISMFLVVLDSKKKN